MKGPGQHGEGGPDLRTAVSNWPTPRCNGPEKRGNFDATDPRNGLPGAAALWGTPKASDGEKGDPNMAYSAGGTPLPAQWMTPNVPNGGRSAAHAEVTGRTAMHNGKKVQVGLEHQVKQWPTPTARDHKGADLPSREGGRSLPMMTSTWPQPTSASPTPVIAPEAPNTNSNAVNGPTSLMEAASICCSPPDPATPDGAKSCTERRVLNPRFVEWLMGWPIGWTNLDCAETESSAWLQRARGWLSTLCTAQPETQGQLL